jgi:hypothetical protein
LLQNIFLFQVTNGRLFLLTVIKTKKHSNMKNRLFISEKNEGFESNFKSLNNDEMNNLRGGTGKNTDLPPSGGDDYPIDPYK